jgi:hypothetical protein
MSNVIPFVKKEEEEEECVWKCECGCALFFLLIDGTIECGECEAEQIGIGCFEEC